MSAGLTERGGWGEVGGVGGRERWLFPTKYKLSSLNNCKSSVILILIKMRSTRIIAALATPSAGKLTMVGALALLYTNFTNPAQATPKHIPALETFL